MYDCVGLDLDDSLIYSSEEDEGNGINIDYINVYGETENIWVHKRPGFDLFLNQCFRHMKVGVWSRGQPGYVNAVVKLFPQEPLFVYNFTHCDRHKGHVFKRLNNIPYDGKILMIDDRPDILESSDKVDIYIIPCWTPNETNDRELFKIANYIFNNNHGSLYG